MFKKGIGVISPPTCDVDRVIVPFESWHRPPLATDRPCDPGSGLETLMLEELMRNPYNLAGHGNSCVGPRHV